MKIQFRFRVLMVVAVMGLGYSLPPATREAHAAETQGKAQSTSQLETLLARYAVIQKALADDQVAGVQEEAKALATATSGLRDRKLSKEVRRAAEQLAQLSPNATIKEVRAGFKKLSVPVVALVKKEKPAEWNVMHCGMARAGWVQKEEEIKNPYHGKEMLNCGEKVS